MRSQSYLSLIILTAFTASAGMIGITGCASSSSPSSEQPLPTEATMLTIGQHLIPEWSAGINGGIPDVTAILDVTSLGAVANDGQDDTAAFKAALISAAGQGAVTIPEGQFQLSDTLTLPADTVLRGAGKNTELLIRHTGDAFSVLGSGTGANDASTTSGLTRVLSGVHAGSLQIEVSNATEFSVGSGIELVQAYDANLHETQASWAQDWAQRLIGHYTQVLAIQGNLITLAEPVRMDMSLSLGVWVAPVDYTNNAGFEDFSVTRQTSNDSHTFNIKYASNVWLRGIQSYNTNRCHVLASQGRRLEVRDSHFQYASDYGDGGHGYGVDLSQRQTASLIINNRFEHLRHALVLHLGANGNVIAYNASTDAHQDDGRDWEPDDFTLHGHYAYSNLIESNILEGISISDYWGPTGPDNVLFRNSVRRDGVAAYDFSQDQIIVGNRLTDPGFELDDSIDTTSWVSNENSHSLEDAVEPGTPYSSSTVSRTQSTSPLPDSYFLESAPAFYGTRAWPSLGADKDSSAEFLPAESLATEFE